MDSKHHQDYKAAGHHGQKHDHMHSKHHQDYKKAGHHGQKHDHMHPHEHGFHGLGVTGMRPHTYLGVGTPTNPGTPTTSSAHEYSHFEGNVTALGTKHHQDYKPVGHHGQTHDHMTPHSGHKKLTMARHRSHVSAAELPRGWSFPDRVTVLASDATGDETQCEPAATLGNIYEQLGSQLADSGFVRSEIEEGHSDFDQDASGEMTPRMYNHEPWCMQGEGPVRPIALRVSDIPDLKAKVLAAVDDVVDALGPNAKVIRQPPDALHATLFHPDTFYAWRKNESGLANESQTPEQTLPMSNASLEREHGLIRGVTSKHPYLTLEVDRLTTTSGGVMLLLLRPAAERQCDDPPAADALRQSFLEVFPSGSSPTHILHVSLLRLLDLPDDELESRPKW